MDVKDIIKAKRIEKNLTLEDVARKVGVSAATISRWESGDIANMKRDKIVNLANALSVSPAVIMGWEQPATDTYPKGVVINVLGRVAAGIPIEAIEEIIDTEEISQEMASTGEFFGLKIHGDSMEPRMYEGDVVIVRKQEDADSGDIVIAMVNGDDATCKRLVKYENGINLLSLNSKYAPIVFSKEEIETKPVRIIGKVVELRGKF